MTYPCNFPPVAGRGTGAAKEWFLGEGLFSKIVNRTWQTEIRMCLLQKQRLASLFRRKRVQESSWQIIVFICVLKLIIKKLVSVFVFNSLFSLRYLFVCSSLLAAINK